MNLKHVYVVVINSYEKTEILGRHKNSYWLILTALNPGQQTN